MERASRLVPPRTGALPTLGPVWPKTAPSAAMARSQATTSSLPPPTAAPLTAAITGEGWVLISVNSRQAPSNSSRRRSGSGSSSSPRWPPAQKAPPEPVITSTPARLERTAMVISARSGGSNAFRTSGRSIRIQVTPSRSSIRSPRSLTAPVSRSGGRSDQGRGGRGHLSWRPWREREVRGPGPPGAPPRPARGALRRGEGEPGLAPTPAAALAAGLAPGGAAGPGPAHPGHLPPGRAPRLRLPAAGAGPGLGAGGARRLHPGQRRQPSRRPPALAAPALADPGGVGVRPAVRDPPGLDPAGHGDRGQSRGCSRTQGPVRVPRRPRPSRLGHPPGHGRGRPRRLPGGTAGPGGGDRGPRPAAAPAGGRDGLPGGGGTGAGGGLRGRGGGEPGGSGPAPPRPAPRPGGTRGLHRRGRDLRRHLPERDRGRPHRRPLTRWVPVPRRPMIVAVIRVPSVDLATAATAGRAGGRAPRG